MTRNELWHISTNSVVFPTLPDCFLQVNSKRVKNAVVRR